MIQKMNLNNFDYRKITNHIYLNKFEKAKNLLYQHKHNITQSILNKIIDNCFYKNKFEFVQFLIDDYGIDLLNFVEYYSSGFYVLEIEAMQFLLNNNIDIQYIGARSVPNQVRRNRLDCIKFLFDNGLNIESIMNDDIIFINSINNGNINIIKFFVESGYIYTTKIIQAANLLNPTITLITFLQGLNLDLSECYQELLVRAVSWGNLEFIEYFSENIHPICDHINPHLFWVTIFRSKYNITKFFLENGYKLDKIDDKDINSFHKCCIGNLEIAKHMYSLNNDFGACNNEHTFIECCKFGNLEGAKFLYQISSGNINIHAKYDTAFKQICQNGHIDIIKYLFSIDDRTDTTRRNELIFGEACIHGKMEIIKYLLTIDDNINIDSIGNYVFRESCENGHFEVAKLIYDLRTNKNVYPDEYCFFNIVCINGHLEIAKWLYELDSNISISKFEDAFSRSCMSGHLKVVEWLSNLNQMKYITNYSFTVENACLDGYFRPFIIKWLCQYALDNNIETNYWHIFNSCCEMNSVKTAKWVYELCGHKIDIHMNDDYVFQNCCINQCVKTAQWLVSICDNYEIGVLDDVITDWEIY